MSTDSYNAFHSAVFFILRNLSKLSFHFIVSVQYIVTADYHGCHV